MLAWVPKSVGPDVKVGRGGCLWSPTVRSFWPSSVGLIISSAYLSTRPLHCVAWCRVDCFSSCVYAYAFIARTVISNLSITGKNGFGRPVAGCGLVYMYYMQLCTPAIGPLFFGNNCAYYVQIFTVINLALFLCYQQSYVKCYKLSLASCNWFLLLISMFLSDCAYLLILAPLPSL